MGPCCCLPVAALALVAMLAAPPTAAAEPLHSQAGQTAPALRDSLLNGTLIGAAVGFGVGFLGLAAFNARETASGPIWDGEALGIYTSVGLLGALVGAGVGAAVDAGRRNHGWAGRARPFDVVPVVDGRRRGVMLAIRR